MSLSFEKSLSIFLQFYEGEQPVVAEDTFLGCIQIGPLPRARAGVLKIKVSSTLSAIEKPSFATAEASRIHTTKNSFNSPDTHSLRSVSFLGSRNPLRQARSS